MFGKIEKVIPEVKQKLLELKSKGPQENMIITGSNTYGASNSFIKDEPLRYFTLYFKKFMSFFL